MKGTPDHPKNILLVEDQEQFHAPVTRWLQDEGYQVTLASTYEAALAAIDSRHYHLAIVDIRLVDNDPTNEAGMDLLYEIEQRKLNDVMPCIVLTAYENVNNILVATQERHVARYIQKTTGYRTKLLEAIRELFAENIRINFDLIYDVGSIDLIREVANDVNWSISGRPDREMLVRQVRDLFGKLFADARRVHITKLKPGLTGAAVIRVQPTWRRGLGPSFVAKIGRRDKVEVEGQNYEEYVRPYLPPNTIAQVKDVAYTRHVGALLYTFAENDMIPLREFDEFYRQSQPAQIAKSLHNLFQNTCRFWYDARERVIEDLPALYYHAFQLHPDKLVHRIQVVLPQFDPTAETFRFNRLPVTASNPIAWLNRHGHECVMPAYRCITHGDLTGRNIMVDQNGKCWLIDFYRTYDSHILRDFVILETDVKYRLLQNVDLAGFFQMEEALLLMDETGVQTTLPLNIPNEVRKALQVLNSLRTLAREFSSGFSVKYQESRREYLVSLLMATLNVVRLRHIEEDRKLYAMLSAALICAELDKLAGRRPIRPRLKALLATRKQDAPAAPSPAQIVSQGERTAQQRFLAYHLAAGNLILFLGSDERAWGHESALLEQIAALHWQSIYTTNRHTQLEQTYQKIDSPYVVITQPEARSTLVAGQLPIYKLYGTQNEALAADKGNGRLGSRLPQFLADLRQALQDGVFVLMICASRSELMMCYDLCYTPQAPGLICITGAEIPEDEQDDYRKLGLRVLPDTPAALLEALTTLVN